MAFMSQLILSAAVLLAVLAATSATVGTQCVPGSDIPYNPLQACRNLLSTKMSSFTLPLNEYEPSFLLIQRLMSIGTPTCVGTVKKLTKICSVGPVYASAGMLKRRCCDQLSRVPAYCRCEALRMLMDGVETPQGVFEGGLLQDIPSCPRLTRKYTMGLVGPEECNLETIHGSPHCPTPITRGVVV
ncbi:trypsin inhibitor CMe-like [Aegilops tauschii subsp. strangulata]|uniref:trypsin inhibitor CMe-like n=1 Tax=Aegilops tauschii subsp. strangulata TaxID=200361 RepID=UPI003CC89EEC